VQKTIMMPVYEEDAPTQLGGYIERWCRFATEGELGIEEFHQPTQAANFRLERLRVVVLPPIGASVHREGAVLADVRNRANVG
jgi:hypothetical protein